MEHQFTKEAAAGGAEARPVTGAGRTREEQALAELGHTSVSRGLAWTLTTVFLVTLLIVPVVQAWSALKERHWQAFARPVEPTPTVVHAGLPAALDVFNGLGRLVALVPSAVQIRRFETRVEQQSVVGEFVRGRAQALISAWFGLGTDNVYIGQDRWLFYRMGVDYVTGPGFLSPQFLAQRRGMADAVEQPDPRPSILRLREQLARRGISLVLFPTPDKVMMHPDRLHGSATRWASMPQNPSYDLFKEDLERDGVHVFDPSAGLYSKRGAQQLFLRGDSHWMPGTVESVAHDLAQEVRKLMQWSDGPSNYRVRDVDVILPQFDLVNLMQLPPGQAFIDPITVRVRQVVGPAADLWTPTPSADVLILGDSFCMAYENDQAGRPLAGGLPQQLSYELQRPVDRICVAGGGSYLSRQLLTNDLSTGQRRLTNVRVVIWQFAIRELAVNDWRVIDLPGP